MRGDLARKLNEASLTAFRKRLNDQTGYIHLLYHHKDDKPEVTIPVMENFLYAWALLRSKTAENILEAKNHLDKLLPFQAELGFPVYLHEFPQVKDRVLNFHIYALLAGILKGFQGVLGHELKGKIEAAMQRLFVNCQMSLSEFNVPFSAQVRAACAANDTAWLTALAANPAWHSTADLGTLIGSLYTVYPRLADSPWKGFWEQLQIDWHRNTMSYQGEAKLDYQNGYEPQATLLDLVMGVFYGTLSKRALADGPHLLQAPWIPQIDEEASEKYEPPFHLATNPFRCHFGSPERVHTLVCQGGNIRSLQITRDGDDVEMIFDLDTLPETEEKEKLREIVFFLDYADTHSITFNGSSSTTFQITDLVEINSPAFKATMQFELLEGSGQWMGHLMRGNRPGQIAAKGANRFQSYDWQIILRTLRRTSPCKIGCRLAFSAGA